jgi:hypothetical protein
MASSIIVFFSEYSCPLIQIFASTVRDAANLGVRAPAASAQAVQ